MTLDEGLRRTVALVSREPRLVAGDPGARPQLERLGLKAGARLMRALVFGTTGQVARELARRAPAHGIALDALGRDRADLADADACARAGARGATPRS